MPLDEWSGQGLVPKDVSDEFEARAAQCRTSGCLPVEKDKYGRWRCPRCGSRPPQEGGEG